MGISVGAVTHEPRVTVIRPAFLNYITLAFVAVSVRKRHIYLATQFPQLTELKKKKVQKAVENFS